MNTNVGAEIRNQPLSTIAMFEAGSFNQSVYRSGTLELGTMTAKRNSPYLVTSTKNKHCFL